MHLVRQAHPYLSEHIEDRIPPVGKAHDGLDLSRAAARGEHLLGGSPAYRLGIAVAPDPAQQQVTVPRINSVVAHRLAREMADSAHTFRSCLASISRR
jgi:hypothetical protein